MHVTPRMVLAGCHSTDRIPADLDSPRFLALTYVFHETDCLSSAGHDFWLQIIKDSTLQVFAKTVEPTLIALEVCVLFFIIPVRVLNVCSTVIAYPRLMGRYPSRHFYTSRTVHFLHMYRGQ
jgi:hypothetical protein